MEEAGALTLAALVLSLAARAAREATSPALGRLLAQRGLVERRRGELEVASDLYAEAGRLGRRAGDAELQSRAQLGLGVVARERGNYPEARRRFGRALRVAERAGLAELTGLAHEGLMISAAVAEDFDGALRHGWSAFAHAAGAPAREADVLTNLGTLCLDIGQDAAALGAFLAAAERASGPRTATHARAGAAVASARVGDRATLERLTEAVVRTTGPDAPPYEAAQHLLTLSDAWEAAGEPARADALRARGLAIARPRAFAELVHRYAARPAATAPSADAPRAGATALSSGARRVVRRLSALASPGGPEPRPDRPDGR
jgi:tetratricopeptide (TPR) repeat protein